jgi:alcohol dehydrogenase class IV
MLPHIMRFNLATCTAIYARFAFAMGVGRVGDDDAANALAAIGAVEALSAAVGTAKRLGDFGMTDELVDVIAADALADVVTQSASIEPTFEQARALVAAAL